MIHLIKKHSLKNGEKIAFNDSINKITYSELYTNILKISNGLLRHVNKNENAPIVVLIDRNIESLILFLSIAVTGNFYVPIDISQPQNRILLIIDTLQPKLLINATEQNFELEYNETKALVSFNELKNCEAISEGVLEEIDRGIIDTDPLYAMFTSGSTGTPKGVLISRRSVKDVVTQFNKEFNFTSDDIFGNQAPFDFDVSVKDIYNCLHIGATLVIIPKNNFMFPNKLIDFLNEYKITVGIWAVSVLRIVENFKGFKNKSPETLRKIMFSGEVMPNKILNYWRKNLPEVEFVNLYGPTEITCNCTFYKVDDIFADEDPLPIGVPFENTRIILLNKEDEMITSYQEKGEICVVGSSLALGYYNNIEITDKVFTLNPLNSNWKEYIYRTGDIGYYREDNLLMFTSRKDSQIKHMGHRIELGEIEKWINSLDGIEASFCIYDKEIEKIILFYQSEEEINKEIYTNMLKHVPKYMIPNKMIHFYKFPLNNNSKIDRLLISKDYYDQRN